MTNLDAFKKNLEETVNNMSKPKIVVKKMMIYPWYNPKKKITLMHP